MSRPTRIVVNQAALLHNLQRIKTYAPTQKVIAMVKANAYGCGISSVAPVLDGRVDLLGVACLEEALTIKELGVRTDCLLFQGVFSSEEYDVAARNRIQCVIHQPEQLKWLLNTPLSQPLSVWVKVNTGMNRLGFGVQAIHDVLTALHECSWVNSPIGLITHFSAADERDNPGSLEQIKRFNTLNLPGIPLIKSLCNSAGIIDFPQSHADAVRPGIMLYGVSPFPEESAQAFGLLPVVQFLSALSAVHHYPQGVGIGYGSTWKTLRSSIIGVIPVGYGDGYPRHITSGTPVWINHSFAPIVGRVSMDMITVDLTDVPGVSVGTPVELWGRHVAVERIAKAAGTIPYELLCQLTPRARRELR